MTNKIEKLKNIVNLIQNMGLRYFLFRVQYIFKTKLGWQKKAFPLNPKEKTFISLEDWKENLPPFFFQGKNIKGLDRNESETLKEEFENIEKGIFTFFSKTKFNLGTNYDWITNPVSNYKYDISKHWSEIQDLSAEAGDIKFVWEKARFSYLNTIIRYDYHFQKDQSEFVFQEIENFIDKNPINQGPNYKCSQEISLRILNWTFALHYYKDAAVLNEALFQKIMNAIFWQLHHVYHNIHFSRIAVRNNHAITETLTLYLSNKLFPFIAETKKWSKEGKSWFEQEIEYQIYEDGTFLQFSMNYHRVVIQLLTWGIQLAKLNNDSFKKGIYGRAEKSLHFLDTCSDAITGELPNYGSNDGALFFKFTDDAYRNYRSQLDDLRLVLESKSHFNSESRFWYGFDNAKIIECQTPKSLNNFEKGGYYIIQEQNTKTFLKCGSYKDRPAQSDNLHLDIWINGINFLRDSGSYKYNTEQEYINYFTGCEGHNTVSVEGKNQMLKGSRFIWYNWIQRAKATLSENENSYEFNGSITAFKELGQGIQHHRKVIKNKSENVWKVADVIENKGHKTLYQYWHLHPDYINSISIISENNKGEKLKPLVEEKWFSGYYGVKEKAIRLTFSTKEKGFNTTIKISC